MSWCRVVIKATQNNADPGYLSAGCMVFDMGIYLESYGIYFFSFKFFAIAVSFGLKPMAQNIVQILSNVIHFMFEDELHRASRYIYKRTAYL